jgi:hypothetical protein
VLRCEIIQTPLPPLDVGPSFALTRINRCVLLASPSGRGSIHRNSLVDATPQGKTPTVFLEIIRKVSINK